MNGCPNQAKRSGYLGPDGRVSKSSYPEVVDSVIGDLLLDPIEGSVVSGTVFLLHEVGQVGHATQLIQVRRSQVLGLKDHRDPKVFLCQLHGPSTVLKSEIILNKYNLVTIIRW